ncbi:MAG: universal stress protein [Xanthomonadales bacterium]|nr:universal stress protein [Gammaproteobacteria bacterium]NNK03410.1 universal stress protein [Xanthomonadales bacterium]
MSIYKRILVATDFSIINLLAAKRAALLARLDNSELILLHVIEHFPADSGGPLASVFQYNTEQNDALAREVLGKLDEFKRSLGHKETKTEFRISSRSARSEILRFAKEHEVDLIVVAPHGQGVIGSLGSTATGVLNNADCDVLAVREDSEDR